MLYIHRYTHTLVRVTCAHSALKRLRYADEKNLAQSSSNDRESGSSVRYRYSVYLLY